MANKTIVTLKFSDLDVKYEKRCDKTIPATLTDVLAASDLKPGIYEGGFKIWECSIDLCRYLATSDRHRLDGKRVLELGCGAGLPGIVALKKGAEQVSFQDFNDEVINQWTKSNVRLNCASDAEFASRCAFLIGDWDETRSQCENEGHKFDIVLTSETIYNIDNYGKLISTIDCALGSSGYALLAAKSYYFGVGGSIDSFLDFVKADKTFETETLWTSLDTAIVRQIILLRRRD